MDRFKKVFKETLCVWLKMLLIAGIAAAVISLPVVLSKYFGFDGLVLLFSLLWYSFWAMFLFVWVIRDAEERR